VFPALCRCRPLLPHHLQPRLQHLTDCIDPGAQGCVDQVCVALDGADLRVAEEAPDHFQRCAAGDEQRGEGVAQVMDADVGDLSDLLHIRPEALGTADGLVSHIRREQEGADVFSYAFSHQAN